LRKNVNLSIKAPLIVRFRILILLFVALRVNCNMIDCFCLRILTYNARNKGDSLKLEQTGVAASTHMLNRTRHDKNPHCPFLPEAGTVCLPAIASPCITMV
jgi:hypothetical protein